MVNTQTLKEFLKGTRNKNIVEVSQGNNDNIVFNGTYAELKQSRKDLLSEDVTSYDVDELEDGTLIIGVMIMKHLITLMKL